MNFRIQFLLSFHFISFSNLLEREREKERENHSRKGERDGQDVSRVKYARNND